MEFEGTKKEINRGDWVDEEYSYSFEIESLGGTFCIGTIENKCATIWKELSEKYKENVFEKIQTSLAFSRDEFEELCEKYGIDAENESYGFAESPIDFKQITRFDGPFLKDDGEPIIVKVFDEYDELVLEIKKIQEEFQETWSYTEDQKKRLEELRKLRPNDKALLGSFELEEFHFQDFYHNPAKSRIYNNKKIVYVSQLADTVWETQGVPNDEGSFDRFITWGSLDTDSLMCSCTLFKDYKVINSIFLRDDNALDFSDRNFIENQKDKKCDIDIEY